MAKVSSLLTSLQTWLLQRRRSLIAWFSTDQKENSLPEESLKQLPSALRRRLMQQLKHLPSHPDHADQLKTDFRQAFQAWHSRQRSSPDDWEGDHHDNVWIIVSPSVANLPDVMGVFLKAIADGDAQDEAALSHQGLPLQLVRWSTRPDGKSLSKELQQQENKFSSTDGRRIVVIPCLEQCFLRSVSGLEVIDCLTQDLLSDPSRFWIIGLGQVSWRYLQAISALDHYSDRTTHLEELSGEQLSNWIDPVISELSIEFQSSLLRSQFTSQNLDWKTKYFSILADEAKGVDTVAVQLFLNTLQVINDDDHRGDDQATQLNDLETDKLQGYKIHAKLPERPGMPKLMGESEYLLYSLLLHRTLTRQELADSLGMTLRQIIPWIQSLRQAGVIEQQGQTLTLNPIYYPTVCTKLEGDNFSL